VAEALKTIAAKCDTPENWEVSGYIPKNGELIVYDCIDGKRLKIGNAVDNASALPFIDIEVDTTLTASNTAADARTVGNELSLIKQRLDNLGNFESGLTSYEVDGNVTLESLYMPLQVAYADGHVQLTM
jgi:hypothetical protein